MVGFHTVGRMDGADWLTRITHGMCYMVVRVVFFCSCAGRVSFSSFTFVFVARLFCFSSHFFVFAVAQPRLPATHCYNDNWWQSFDRFVLCFLPGGVRNSSSFSVIVCVPNGCACVFSPCLRRSLCSKGWSTCRRKNFLMAGMYKNQ